MKDEWSTREIAVAALSATVIIAYITYTVWLLIQHGAAF